MKTKSVVAKCIKVEPDIPVGMLCGECDNDLSITALLNQCSLCKHVLTWPWFIIIGRHQFFVSHF